jgi:proteasome accessory factor BC
VAPERFGVLQSLLAYLLAACGDERDAVIQAHELVERFSIPPEALEEHLSLLNLVNFGGGCYAVYAELHGDEVHVDKELFGDTFRRAPRLTPLEARAIRLALEFVGPMIAAGSASPLDRVRAKLEEAFGVFDLAQTPTPQAGAEEDLVATLTRAIDGQRVVELEYLKPESTEVETRTIEPYGIERRLPHWYVHTWDVDRDAPRSYRLDRMRKAKLLRRGFLLREGFDRSELHHATTARIWYSPVVARWQVEKGARPLVDGAALAERAVGSADWVVGEVLSFGGEGVVLEPPELRALVATRARELERELRAARAGGSLLGAS